MSKEAKWVCTSCETWTLLEIYPTHCDLGKALIEHLGSQHKKWIVL